ncbi:hypothetical protein NBT05_13770 [Aquimarina sp. ERC-38]|uniref:hypothetical protein n=1 Tax=Aquimarina sp. ERC-38 TaxID=2949996 RepID=UPI0022466981|nr:hypothetical protein [Aquimarina sp. ERC-38]UZO80010.1 hypothetical protein NBT05_13770 [Aquimarina sp. ERC-38]
MKKYIFVLISCFTIIFWSSCRKDFDSEPSTGNLEFSTDTLVLDTIFSNISSSTYQFKVYNRTGDDFTIPRITLRNGEASNYRLNVDGIAGTSFNDIQILAKDSIFIFVETTTDITQQSSETEFLYTDQILFDPDGNQQDVDLVTLIKDAVFLFPSRDNMTGETETLLLGLDENEDEIRIEGFFLDDDELTFTNEKPYVIYGFAAIPPEKTLTIEAGTRIHFHENSGLIAANMASLQVNGEVSTDPLLQENEVIFEGDRLEPEFSEIPGQWGFIWLTAGSTNHKINHATIKNGTVGILMASNDGGTDPTLEITNTQIYNQSNVGLLMRTGNVRGENVVINNAGQVAVSCSLGGIYNFEHCTFANYWQNGSQREFPSVLIDNNILVNPNTDEATLVIADLVEANFTNCIINGNRQQEIGFNKTDQAAFNFNFKNCLIQYTPPSTEPENPELYDFTDTALYRDIILNEDADYRRNLDRFTDDDTDLDLRRKSQNFLNIGEESAADGKATAPGMGVDITGKTRDMNAPDIGAYESVMFRDREEDGN